MPDRFIGKIVPRLKKIYRLGRNAAVAFRNSLIYRGYFDRPLDSKLYFLEGRNGKEAAGNILRIMLYLQEHEGADCRMVVSITKEKQPALKLLLENYGITKAKIIKYNSVSYYRQLSRAKYLITDVSFPGQYIKKDGQIILNTWHGTPYKCMGRENPADCTRIDNVQRNFLMSDILLFPSEYCKETMMRAYSLKDLYQGNVLMAGYPRNTIFFNEKKKKEIREQYQLEGKKVYMYLPTFRESGSEQESQMQADLLERYLLQLDEKLADDEIFYVKLHNLVQQRMKDISFKHFQKIRPFPEGVETYEFLSCADCLVTDYSSVMFDFALSGKKIIRFVYDEDTYFKNRGFYRLPTEIPFPKVYHIDELLSELRCTKGYHDSGFLETYCQYDNRNATDIIMRAVKTAGKKAGKAAEQTEKADQKAAQTRKTQFGSVSARSEKPLKVFFYGGALSTNGITSSLLNLLQQNAVSSIEAYLGADRVGILETPDVISGLPDHIRLLEINTTMNHTLAEMLTVILFHKYGFQTGFTKRILDRLYERENRRIFTGMPFDVYVQFNGYGANATRLLQRSRGKRIIFVHNDMWSEAITKKNCNLPTLRDAYQTYDEVAIVSSQLRISVERICGKMKRTISLVHNLQDYEKILEKSLEPLRFGDRTAIYPELTEADVELFLNSHRKCIIHIGRFSHEKNHKLLLDSFAEFLKREENAGLILIGGTGKDLEEVKNMVMQEIFKDHVIMIENIPNPMPVLKKCGLLLMTSKYEGMPMVFFEADILGIPVASVRAPGCTECLEEYGGYLTENSMEGVQKALEDFIQDKIYPMNIDFKEYNEQALEEFFSLLNA